MEKELDCCEVNEVHGSVLKKVTDEMPDEVELDKDTHTLCSL